MDDYHTSAVTEVIDPRKDALTKPLMSGVLSNVSVEMANKMWYAIMQGNFNFFYLLKCFSSWNKMKCIITVCGVACKIFSFLLLLL